MGAISFPFFAVRQQVENSRYFIYTITNLILGDTSYGDQRNTGTGDREGIGAFGEGFSGI